MTLSHSNGLQKQLIITDGAKIGYYFQFSFIDNNHHLGTYLSDVNIIVKKYPVTQKQTLITLSVSRKLSRT